MLVSSILRSSLARGPALKSLTNQIIRSSSICIASNHGTPTTTSPMASPLSRTQLLVPKSGASKILAKYISCTSALNSAEKAHDHVGIWKLERVLSAAMLPLIPAALAFPNATLDTIVAVTIVMHNHWGLEALVVDYVRPILFGEIGPKIGMGLLYLFSAVTLAGLLNLIFNDVGLANTVVAFWKL